MRLSIIVPAFNEEHRLGRMLDAYLPYFTQRFGALFEVLVIVNGSTDRTADVALARRSDWPMIRVFVDPRPIGKGGAIMIGLKAARGELIGYVDADGSTPPEAFDALVEAISDADCVLANRWDAASTITPPPRRRRVASRLFNRLVRLFFGLRLRDTQCGAKLLRRSLVCRLLPKLGITRWAFDVDLLYNVYRVGGRIREIPTVWHDESGSHLKVVPASLDMFLALCRLRLLYSPFRWFVTLYDRTLGPWIHPPLPPPPPILEVTLSRSATGHPSTDHTAGKSRH